MMVPVILCGGSGTRLWPLSRSSYPKQFVDFGDGETLFKETLRRANVAAENQKPYVITSEALRFYAQANLYEMNQQASIIIEPVARNTAPAIAAAAVLVSEQNPDAVLLVLPSDHAIDNIEEFKKAVESGKNLAEEGYLVTFGIKPTSPETGYGYIKLGNKINPEGYIVEEFIEKPKEELAKQLIESAGCYWNSGIFMFKASCYLEELDKYAPSIKTKVIKAANIGVKDNNVVRLDKEEFSKASSISVDYAVMEHTDKAVTVPLKAKWTDLGSWESFYENKLKDEQANVLEGDVIALNTSKCYINSQNRLVVTNGISNLAIIETRDAILVTPLDRSQEVREVVERLKKDKRTEAEINSLVFRPWGSYESLARGDRFQVKRIIVNPGEELSLQKHYHRAEHWIIVKGSAEVKLGQETLFVTENQSIYIPVGECHQLRNPGKIPLVVVEVQSGSYLGEDDIVRIKDKYNRN